MHGKGSVRMLVLNAFTCIHYAESHSTAERRHTVRQFMVDSLVPLWSSLLAISTLSVLLLLTIKRGMAFMTALPEMAAVQHQVYASSRLFPTSVSVRLPFDTCSWMLLPPLHTSVLKFCDSQGLQVLLLVLSYMMNHTGHFTFKLQQKCFANQVKVNLKQLSLCTVLLSRQ